MPLSSVVVAGNPALASQYNNLRLDAMARIETVTAGEAYTATTLVTNNSVDQAYSLPTLLQQDSTSGKWLKMDGDILGLGARVRIGMAYEASAGDGSSVRIYLPGSLINGLNTMTSEVGRTALCSKTSGAVESTVLPPYYTCVGWWPSATSFMFEGLMFNNINLKQLQSPVVSGEAFSVRDLLYLKASDGRAYKADADAAESGICEKPLFAAQASTGAGQTVLAFTAGAYIVGLSGLTAGTTYYPSSTSGALSATKGTFSRGVLFAISSSEGIFMPNELEFLPPGLQETGVAAGGWQTDNGTWASVEKHHYPIRFRKQMCNVPSSLTLSWATSQNNVTVTTPYINAYGASLLLATNGSTNLSQEVIRFGTYVTVGN